MSDPELEKILQKKASELVKGRMQVTSEPVITLHSSGFDSIVHKGQPILVDFWAEWCAPCRYMHPIFEKLASKYAARIRFGRLNVDENGDIAARYHVFSIPTFILFKDSQPVGQVLGAVGERGLESLINKHAF